MPKTNKKSTQPDGVSIIPTESPVSGVNIELANLLVQAIKARRKFLSKSKSSSSTEDDDAERQSMLQNLQNKVNDKTNAFLNDLRRRVEHSSAASASKASSRRSNKPTSSPPTHCLEFLLGVLSDRSNSFHLRRSALDLAREILERSADARAYLAGGRFLLDFVSVVEGVENDHVEDVEDHSTGASISNMSPKAMFQLEAMELIHHLATKFGKFYTQFTGEMQNQDAFSYGLYECLSKALCPF